MRIVEFIRDHSGIAHRRTLLAAGFSRYMMRRAEQADAIRRVRRDWFMVPGCDEAVYRAVLAGGSLSCVSAAKLAGMWVTRDDALHIAASAHSGHVDSSAQAFRDGVLRPVTVHWREMLAGAIRPATDSLESILVNIAECQSLEDAVATLDSALRFGFMVEGELRMLSANSRSEKLREAVKFVDGRADSGIESIPRVRLKLQGIEMVPQALIDGHQVDGLIGERLVLQFDGFGPHSSRAQRSRDLRQDARLTLLGYVVFRFSYDAVMFDWTRVECTIFAALAQGKHRAAA